MKRAHEALDMDFRYMFAVVHGTAAPVYKTLVCRDNDPFVFCTQACKGVDKNWSPVDPISDTWRADPGYCWKASPVRCCKHGWHCGAWTPTAIAAVQQYQDICPAAAKQGNWTDPNRSPESVPYEH
ncbi:hypothetical protein [uncultured Xanthomonas sp.]|uniref:hypothetical protein n=1 Tax=uncultured Xanthomonas sp. TaxID=152831 RepID=UPI0025EBE4F8|nr:hypothetical protein [uncultured Xanthomonas sp.]